MGRGADTGMGGRGAVGGMKDCSRNSFLARLSGVGRFFLPSAVRMGWRVIGASLTFYNAIVRMRTNTVEKENRRT